MNKEIEKLKTEYSAAQQNLKTLRDKITEMEAAERMPALKKQYSGKYFKYSHPADSGTPSFFAYYFCREVTGTAAFRGDTFESSPEYSRFRTEHVFPLSHLQFEISADEYFAALALFELNFQRLRALNITV